MLGKSFKIIEPKRFDLYIEDIHCKTDEAIIRIDYGAICKADLRYYLGARDKRTLGFKYPMSLLHEAVGTIVLNKTNKYKTGDKVVLIPNIIPNENDKCLNCVCENPQLGENYCPNAKFASSNSDGFGREYVNYPVTHLIKIPSNLEYRIAIFSELISVAIAAYRRIQLQGNETIAIWGDGILGYILCCVLQVIHKEGKIIAVGKHENKIKQFPADKHYLTGNGSIKSENIDVAYECVGGDSSGNAINESVDNIKVGGKIVLTGVAENYIGVNTRKILEKGIAIYGVTRSSVADFQKAIQLFRDEQFRLWISRLILDEIYIENIGDYYNAFEMELKNSKLGKYILHFNL
jgi:ribitol-5-phosphate 2-dehydrogenase